MYCPERVVENFDGLNLVEHYAVHLLDGHHVPGIDRGIVIKE